MCPTTINYQEKERDAYIELVCISLSNFFTLTTELVKKKEPSKAELGEMGEAEKGECRDSSERELNHQVIVPSLAGSAGEDEEGKYRNTHSQDEEEGPREEGEP